MKPPSREQLLHVLLWVALAIGLATFFTNPQISPGGFGIQGGESVTTVEKDQNESILKRTFKVEQGKTVWDWFSLLGVPLTLAVLGYILQQLQQQKSTSDAALQREKADEAAKEEALQLYYDRLSTPLIEKVLLALPSKADKTEQEAQLLESAKDIFRARTLSALRRFSDDPKREESVIRFLIESEILAKLKVNLSGAIINDADLTGAELIDVTLSGADLEGAYLSEANLSNADLSNADLSGADLSGADFSKVKWLSEETKWPASEAFEGARNLPLELKEELGLQ
jgi:hypothetical protein